MTDEIRVERCADDIPKELVGIQFDPEQLHYVGYQSDGTGGSFRLEMEPEDVDSLYQAMKEYFCDGNGLES